MVSSTLDKMEQKLSDFRTSFYSCSKVFALVGFVIFTISFISMSRLGGSHFGLDVLDYLQHNQCFEEKD